jgi:hypothetical protein
MGGCTAYGTEEKYITLGGKREGRHHLGDLVHRIGTSSW